MNLAADAVINWFEQVWSDYHTLIRIGLILIGAIVLRSLLLLSVKRVVKTVVSGVKPKASGRDGEQPRSAPKSEASPLAKARVVQRARTMGTVLGNLITWSVSILAVTMVLSELGVAIGALIAGAGIVGAALGFGAQSLVRDLISGLFIVFEDQFGVGDSVDLGMATGVVETVGLRVTQVRDVEGVLWYVRNGEIIRVGNQSQGWSRVVLDVALPYEVDLAKAQAAIATAANEVAARKEFKADIIGAPDVWGLQVLSGDSLVIRLVQQVRPAAQDNVARSLRLAVKEALDKSKIALASSKSPIFVQVGKSGAPTSAAASKGAK